VRVHDVGVVSKSGAAEAPEEQRQQQREPGPRAQVADDAVPARDAEVPERRRRHHGDVDTALPHVLDRRGDERPAVRRIRRRQDEHLHVVRLWNTTGRASASASSP
jgi:hypothetical protein